MLDINTLCTTKCVMSFVAGIRKVVHLVKLIRTSELYMRAYKTENSHYTIIRIAGNTKDWFIHRFNGNY